MHLLICTSITVEWYIQRYDKVWLELLPKKKRKYSRSSTVVVGGEEVGATSRSCWKSSLTIAERVAAKRN